MKQIEITVRDKIARLVDIDSVIVCDNSDYIAVFEFDSEWDAYDVKTARFKWNGKYEERVFTGTQCDIPVINDTVSVEIGVYAGNLSTTTSALVNAKKSILCGSPVHNEPEPDVYNQIIALLEGFEGASEEEIAAAVADYMVANPIEEQDPTVPEWAKTETKPTYTADEVGAIAESELPTAINTALAQAKASGEFDGAPGKDGADGQPGKNGADGYSPTANVTQNDNGATITITDKNGTTTATVTNGKDGADGNPGADGSPGKDGADGKSAYAYAVEGGYSGTEAEFAAKLAAECPAALPNPYTLTFTGAVTGSYDGSEAVTVNIPSGGGGASGMTLLGEIDCSAVSGNIKFTDIDNYTEFYIIWAGVKNGGKTASGYRCRINNIEVAPVGFVPINTTSVAYGWSYAKYNGLVWMCQNSVGSTSNTLLTCNPANGAGQYNHVLNVGKAMSMYLPAPVTQYQAVSGTIKVYGR